MRLITSLALLPIAWALTLGDALAQPALEKDERLGIAVTLHHHVVSLNDLVRDLQRQTGVPMEVRRDIMEEKATVFVQEKPAHEVMQKIASLFLLRWEERKPDGYRLVPDADARKGEREFLALRERVEHRLWLEWIGRGYHDARRGWGWVQQRIEQYYRLQERLETQSASGQENSASARREMQYPVRNIYDFLAVQTLGRSPQLLWERLKRGEILIASTHPAPGELPLHVPEEALRELFGEKEMPPLDSQPVVRVVLRLSDWLDVYVILQRDASPKGTQGGVRLPLPVESHPSLRTHPLRKRWQDWQSTEEELLKEPALSNPFPHPRPEYPVQGYLDEITDADLFCWFHTVTGIPVLADGSRRIRRCVPHADTPARWLLAFTRETYPEDSYFIRYEGGYVLCRRENYLHLRHSEIPERMLLPLERRVQRGEPLTLDDYAALAVTLNREQLQWLPRRLITPAPQLAMRIDQGVLVDEDVPLLLLWASLSPTQKRALREGEALPAASLSPYQRQLLLHYLLNRSGEEHLDAMLTGQVQIRMETQHETLFVLWEQGERILPVTGSMLAQGGNEDRTIYDDPFISLYLGMIASQDVRSCRGEAVIITLTSGGEDIVGSYFLLRTEALPPLSSARCPWQEARSSSAR
ncbi:MAG: hypothetical protein RMM06_10570 [Armatimonadota bacterium]|nr:hypothetical protein [Armatimonadota bacterium]